MSTREYFADKAVRFPGHNGPVAESLFVEGIKRPKTRLMGKNLPTAQLVHPEAMRVDVAVFVTLGDWFPSVSAVASRDHGSSGSR